MTPTTAYDLLEPQEKSEVDEYVKYAIAEQRVSKEAVCGAMYKPIPTEWIKRSHNILSRPVCRAAIAQKIQEASNADDMSPDKVIKEYINIGTSDMGDFLRQDPFGNMTIKPWNEIDPVKRRAIKKVETRATQWGMTSTITLHDKLPALRALSEMMGLVPDDKPPVLQDYVATPHTLTPEQEQAPELEYQKLLEATG